MRKKPKPFNENPKTEQDIHLIHPWQCRHCVDHSEITAYIEAIGDWQRIVTVHKTMGASAEKIANFITNLVNDHQHKRSLLEDAKDALEAVTNDGLNFSTEQAAESVINRIRKNVI